MHFLRQGLLGICAATALTAGASAGTVTISSPGSGAIVTSPVRVTASATDADGVKYIQVYVDGAQVFHASGAKVDTQLSMAAGDRRVTVQAKDNVGNFFKATVNIKVSSSAVVISSLSDGVSVLSPIHVVASASFATLMQVYLDGVKVYETSGAKIDTNIDAATGTRRVTVQAYNGATWSKESVSVNVAGSTSTTSSRTIWNIDQLSDWQSCSACAGTGGAGPVAQYAMKQNVASPSLDGKAAEFFLGGEAPYANALWWKQLGGHDWAQNFRYELSYYLTDPSASQALEFDVNQTRAGKWYIFGTECDFKDKKVWKVYDPSVRKWMTTSIACTVPKAYTWHSLAFEFRRTPDAGTQFVSVTINGQKHYFNRTYPARAASSSTVNVAFQMDGNKYQTDYKVWLDKIKLTMW